VEPPLLSVQDFSPAEEGEGEKKRSREKKGGRKGVWKIPRQSEAVFSFCGIPTKRKKKESLQKGEGGRMACFDFNHLGKIRRETERKSFERGKESSCRSYNSGTINKGGKKGGGEKKNYKRGGGEMRGALLPPLPTPNSLFTWRGRGKNSKGKKGEWRLGVRPLPTRRRKNGRQKGPKDGSGYGI